jgi:hypothetical protein
VSLLSWTEPSGYSFGTIAERQTVSLALPIIIYDSFLNLRNTTFTVISGQLPPGLRLVKNTIVGTPFTVPRQTTFKFVIRAEIDNEIADRTLSITVLGHGAPTWATPGGELPVGKNQTYYVLDDSYIDFQLTAVDLGLSAGQTLQYFIASGDGQLPPGLVLTSSGRIVGFIQPALVIPSNSGNGYFDETTYDNIAYDFGYKPSNGYDSFIYDLNYFDFSTISAVPKTLNRNYQFTVTVTDGDQSVKQTFMMYVVGADFFHADNTITTAGTGIFTADSSYVRSPIWITPNNLGVVRANNYQIIPLETYKGIEVGPITYSIISGSLPPGLQYDTTSSTIFGAIPYQNPVTTVYTWTVSATALSDRTETNTSSRTFTLTVIGEVDSELTWVTPADLGTIPTNQVSLLSISAIHTETLSSNIFYNITSGQLPPGLTLNLDGEIVGKVPQSSVLTIDQGTFTLDGDTTTLDRVYAFTVEARDYTISSTISREFTITTITVDKLNYSNLVVRPYLSTNKRTLFKSFISNSLIFTPDAIYRPTDANFGIQKNLEMLIYAGIETKTSTEVVSAVGRNHKPKRFITGAIKKARATVPQTTTVVYEVVYLEILDPLEIGTSSLPLAVATSFSPGKGVTVDQSGSPQDPFTVTLDRNDMFAGDPYTFYREPSSVALWRYRISQLGLTEREFLPLWMRSIQSGDTVELGYVKAIPLCYCKPGYADDILLRIKHSGFDFSQLDFTVDRYIIDSVTGYSSDKYIVFRNDRTTTT